MTINKSEQMEVQAWTGRPVLQALADPAFRRQWDSLYAACPWATVFQTRAFTEIWYSVYGPAFEPLIVYARDSAGDLSGLLALGIDRVTGALTPAGAHNAEYHAWLSTADTGDSFIEAAFDHLAARFPRGGLAFLFLPPGAPLGWLKPSRPWGGRARFRAVPRPLMTVGPGGSVEESLRKKSNKSRISRLRKLGPLRLEVVRCRKDIEPYLERIVDSCDLRNGALHDCLPFRDDPFKLEFSLRLVDSPDLTHTSVLLAGDEFVAAHIGARNGTSVQLGLIAHSPFLAQHSPGKILLLLLARELGDEGFQDLDFTPFGEYKDRFADHSDEAYSGVVFFHKRDAHAYDFRRRAAGSAKWCLARAGVTPEAALRRFRSLVRIVRNNGPHGLLFKLVRWVGRRIWSEQQLNYYRMSPQDTAGKDGDPRLQRDFLADLLLYEQATPADRTRSEFLRDALDRLASGGRAYTAAEGRRLMHYSWLSPVAGPKGTDLGSEIDYPPGSISLWDDYTHPSGRGTGLHQASIRARLQEGSALAAGGGIFCSVLADNGPSRRNFERMGFRLYATLVRRWRFGKTHWKWTFER
ncbi:MAG TPA: GNAT family N-acetyltransferase [Bryobacteraceae bacterium]